MLAIADGSSLPVTADAIRRQGLRCTPFQPTTNDKQIHKRSNSDKHIQYGLFII